MLTSSSSLKPQPRSTARPSCGPLTTCSGSARSASAAKPSARCAPSPNLPCARAQLSKYGSVSSLPLPFPHAHSLLGALTDSMLCVSSLCVRACVPDQDRGDAAHLRPQRRAGQPGPQSARRGDDDPPAGPIRFASCEVARPRLSPLVALTSLLTFKNKKTNFLLSSPTYAIRQREFKRNIKREFARLVSVLQAYSIITTNVRITCQNQKDKGYPRYIIRSGPPLTHSPLAHV